MAARGTCGVPIYTEVERGALAGKYLDIDTARAQALLALLTTDVRQAKGLDFFYTPFIQLDTGTCALAMTYAETSRVDRNLFAIAATRGSRHLSVRGFKPIASLQATFRKRGFPCVVNVPIVVEGRVLTDLDLAVLSAATLFVAQAKVAVQPDSPHEVWSIHQKLALAAEQLTAALKSRAAIDAALARSGLRGATDADTVVPFLLTNVWQFTGSRISGFPVVDISYLQMLLRGGVVTEIQGRKVTQFKIIEGRVPSGTELRRLIEEPVHRAMFRRAATRHWADYPIGPKTVKLPLQTLIELPPAEDEA